MVAPGRWRCLASLGFLLLLAPVARTETPLPVPDVLPGIPQVPVPVVFQERVIPDTLPPAIPLAEPLPSALPALPPVPAVPPPPAPPETKTGLTADEVKTLVDQMLKERDEKAKQAEAERKAKDISSRTVTGKWNNGLTFETEDKAFRFNIGGVTQFDMGWYSAGSAQKNSIGSLNNFVDPGTALQDGMNLRRARLRMSGLVYNQIEFYAQYEFANATDLRQRALGIPNPAGVPNTVQTNFDPAETTGFNEVYIGLTKLPVVGNVRVGRHRESLNFVTATADNYQVWMERGLLFDAFNGNWNFSNGVTVARTYLNDRVYTLFGFFQQNSFSNRQFATVGDGNYVYDLRATCLPWWDEDEKQWVHVGFDYSYRNLSMNRVRLRARPDVRVGSAFQVVSLVDTGGVFSQDALQIANVELVSVFGPWTFAAEGTAGTITNAYTGGLPAPDGTLPEDVTPRGTYFATGAYVEFLRFLTPDTRPYVKDRPGYGRVNPARPFKLKKGEDGRWDCGPGAWEVGVRYDYVDLIHNGVNGGMAQGVTGAVNWYLTSNVRVQTNVSWIHRTFAANTDAGKLSGDVTALGIRFNADY